MKPIESLEQAREQMRACLAAVESLAGQPIHRNEFLVQFLQIACVGVQPLGGALWMQSGREVVPLCDTTDTFVNLQSFPEVWKAHGEWVPMVIATGESRVVPADDPTWKVTPGAILLFVPLHQGKLPVGTIELIFGSDTTEEALSGSLIYLEQLCGLASRFLTRDAARKSGGAASAGPPSTPRPGLNPSDGRAGESNAPIPTRPVGREATINGAANGVVNGAANGAAHGAGNGAVGGAPPNGKHSSGNGAAAAGSPASPRAAGPVLSLGPVAGVETPPVALGNVLQPADMPTPSAATSDLTYWREVEQFLLVLERAETVAEVASTAAADARILVNADRLSVIVQRGGSTRVEAVSGQKTVNRRGDLSRATVDLAKAVLPTGEPFLYTSREASYPPSIEEKLAKYLEKSNARTALIIPLFRNERPEPPDENRKDTKKVEKPKKVIGGLVVERMHEATTSDELLDRATLLADHVGAALSNGLLRERVFLLPLWIAVGRFWEWFHGRRAAKAAFFATLAGLLVAVMAFVPWEYRVEGEGKLMPTAQQRVFAPWDGDIIELRAKGGDRVEAGDLLLRLRNAELDSQLTTAETQHVEKVALQGSLRSRIDRLGAASKDERINLQGQLEQTKAEVIGLTKQVELLRSRKAMLEVKAPCSGVVATFQVEQLLLNRPVKRGESLLEVMNADAAANWRLEVRVPEHRLGHLLRGREKLGRNDLPVTFVLATNPETTWNGKLGPIATRADSTEQQERVVEAFVDLEPNTPEMRSIGADVRCRIHCGPRSLGYVLFGDVLEFLQRRFWW